MSTNLRRAVLWIVVALLMLPLERRLSRSMTTANPVRGTESAEVERRLATDFASPFHKPALLVLTGLAQTADSDSGRAAMRAITAPLSASPAVVAVLSPGSSLDTLFVGTRRTTAIVMVGLAPGLAGAMDSVRAVMARHLPEFRRAHPALTMRWTGEPALVGDLRIAGAREARRTELRALPVSIIVSVAAFGSLAAAGVAVGAAVLAILVTLGVMGALTSIVPASSFTNTMVPLVGLALTVDYVLFLTRRTRDGADAKSLQRTVALAAAIVGIGFTGLAIAPTGELRSAAVAGALTALFAAVAAITLTPMRAANGMSADTGQARARPVSPRWLRWGRLVVRRPFLVLLVSATPLLLLAGAARLAHLATPLDQLLPAGMESADAYRDLQQAGRAGAAASLRVLLQLPANSPVISPDGWAALTSATRTLGGVTGVAGVRSLSTIGNHDLFGAQHLLPKLVIDTYVSHDGTATIIDVLPDLRHSDTDVTLLVRALRSLNATAVSGVPGATMLVAGLPAYALDYETALRRALPIIVLATSLATLIALIIAFRAPLVAIKAVTLNLLVAAAAIGTTVLIFQYGFGLPSIFPTVPVLAFGAAFGMSMDYELFLLGGVREARGEGLSDKDAIVVGLGRTGGLITRAAGVMACLFLAFSTSTLLPISMVGTTLAVAVILDATIVRLALAPALLRIAGRWNWWPGLW